MVSVELGGIQAAAWAHNAGVFSGQNIQNSWDSHGASATAFGGSMGDGCVLLCWLAWMRNVASSGQPTFDQDVKGNFVQTLVR